MSKISKTFSEASRKKAKDSWADPVKRAKLIAGIKRTRAKASKVISEIIRNKWKHDTKWAAARRAQIRNQKYTPEQLQKRRERAIEIMNSNKFIAARDIANKSPKKGEKTRRNSENHGCAVNVKLRDPAGKIWVVRNLVKFVREHEYLFETQDVIWEGKHLCRCKATSALRNLWSKKPVTAAKGWTLVSDTEVFYNGGEDLLNRQQHEVHSI